MSLRRRIALVAMALMLVAGCSSKTESPNAWVEDEVTFVVDGLTVHGTYRHQHNDQKGQAALLISESGRTDRNGDNNVAGPVGNMRQLAEYLSNHGVASLRYDKAGTGQTGFGPYADHKGDIGSAVNTSVAKAAVRFLAGQSATDPSRISAYGLGEGTVYAMTLADDTASGAPKIHSLGLLQPLAGRYLDLITTQVLADMAAAVKSGQRTQPQADQVIATWNAAVTEARTKGTVPAKLPEGYSAFVNPGNVKVVVEADAIDPLDLAARIPAATPVLLTCSDSDSQAKCTNMKPLADALAHTSLSLVELKGVSHVLRDDPTNSIENFSKPGPLSPQLTAALDGFVNK